MTNQTKIEWCDFTVNFWEGCQKVGPGCDHCYAEARDQRFTGGQHWGPGAPRRKVKGGVQKMLSIQRKAHEFHAEHGHWPRVFCSSLSDVFDNAVDRGWRHEAFATIDICTDTRVILLTKRVGNVFQMIPPRWASRELGGWPSRVGLMITVVNQEEADRDIPKLLDLKARLGIPWVGLSMEPLLGPVDVERWLPGSYECAIECGWRGPAGMLIEEECSNGHQSDGTHEFCPDCGTEMGTPICPDCNGRAVQYHPDTPCLDWIIVGGESGRNARPMHPDWARSLRDQCVAADVPFLFKQWGEWAPGEAFGATSDDPITDRHGNVRDWMRRYVCCGDDRADRLQAHSFTNHSTDLVYRVGKTRAGRLLDGRTWDQFPEAMT